MALLRELNKQNLTEAAAPVQLPATIFFWEHYPHQMGTSNDVVKFTRKEFAELLELAKTYYKLRKAKDTDQADDVEDKIEDIVDKKGSNAGSTLRDAFGMMDNKPARLNQIVKALNSSGVYAGEWEEGSFAIATSKEKAKKAIAKIESKYIHLD